MLGVLLVLIGTETEPRTVHCRSSMSRCGRRDDAERLVGHGQDFLEMVQPFCHFGPRRLEESVDGLVDERNADVAALSVELDHLCGENIRMVASLAEDLQLVGDCIPAAVSLMLARFGFDTLDDDDADCFTAHLFCPEDEDVDGDDPALSRIPTALYVKGELLAA